MFENTFKNIDNLLRKDSGVSTELDYIEQTSWILFLKYLSDYENEKEKSGYLDSKEYSRIISGKFAWDKWAAPKIDGEIDKNAKTGKPLIKFVNQELFPYLEDFKKTADNPKTTQYKISEIFSKINNKIQNGHNLRKIIKKVDELNFLGTTENKNELSSLYEDKIRNMGNAGRNGGEYYTPRPLIKTIVKVIDPKIGDTVYDGAVGSAGFLCEAFAYMRDSKKLTAKEYQILQSDTFYGKEKKPLAYIIGIMNMMLHGIEAPNIIHTNTLEENIADIQQKDRVDVVLANPPFGGNEDSSIKQNFPIKVSDTAYLFLQHFIKILKKGGRCGMVIKTPFLDNSDATRLRKQLLDECNLFAILDLPTKTFLGTGADTVVLFFEKGKPTKKIWYYQLNLERNLGKINPLNEKRFI